MRKFIAVLIVPLLVVFVASYAYAGSADARTASFGQGISQVIGVGDLSTGNTTEVDANGNTIVKEFTKSVVTHSGDANDVCSGAAIVYAVILSGGDTTSVTDYAVIQDALTTSTPTEANTKLEVTVGTADSTTEIIIPGGVAFTTGVSINTVDAQNIVTIVYSTY